MVAANIYDGAASYGRFLAWLALLAAPILLSSSVWSSVQLAREQDRYSGRARATVTEDGVCVIDPSRGGAPNAAYTCHCPVEFTAARDGRKVQTLVEVSSSIKVPKGAFIDVAYDPAKPTQARPEGAVRGLRLLGGGLICIGVFLCVAAAVWVVIVSNFKFAAAGSAVGSFF
jgi:hypothetical protein